MAKSGDEIKKGAEFVTVMSALPADHEFLLKSGRSLIIKGRPQSLFVGENKMTYEGNQYGETKGVKVEDWKYVINTYGSPVGKDGKKMPEKGLVFLNSGVMFAASTEDERKGMKKDLAKIKTGLEQKNPKSKKRKTTPADKEDK